MTSILQTTTSRDGDHRLWFLSRLGQQTSETLAVAAATVRRVLTPETVKAALAEIEQDHDALLASLALIGNRPQIQTDVPVGSACANIVSRTGSDERSFSDLLWADVHHPGERLTRWAIAIVDGQTMIGLTASRMVCDEIECTSLLAALLDRLGVVVEIYPRPSAVAGGSAPDQQSELLARLAAVEPLSLPTLVGRPPIKGAHCHTLPLGDPDSFTHHLDVISHRATASRIDAAATILAAVLMRHSGTKSVAIGVPVRSSNGREQLLPVSIELSDSSVDSAVIETGSQRAVYDSFPTDVTQLMDELTPGRDPSRTPLFQAALADTAPLFEVDAEDGTATDRVFRSPYDVALTGPTSGRGGEHWSFVFDPTIVDRQTAVTLVDHIERVASSAAAMGAASLVQCPMLSDEEITESETWSSGGSPAAENELLHARAIAQLTQEPSRTAIVDRGQKLTYGELGTAVDRIRRTIRAHQPVADSLVAVVLPKGCTQIASVLAINVEGSTYLPIDPHVPDSRLHYLLDRGRTSLVLTDGETQRAHTWPAGITVVDVATAGVVPIPDDAGPLEPVDIAPDHSAYVIFTSGSTGLPKGVEVAHRSSANTVVDICQRFGVNQNDSVLALSALNFDLSVFDIFGVLGVGGTVVLPDETESRDPGYWARLVESQAITVWNSVPALMELVASEGERDHIDLSSLRLVMMSGDWIPVTLPDRIRALCPNAVIISMGGATEAAIWSIAYDIRRVEPHWDSIPYGTPLAGQAFRVLDEAGNPVPVNVAGELHIGGIGVAKGYWRDHEKTDAAFVTASDGSRWYRTGDFGKYGRDGIIKFLGRRDTQVKVNGYRIELTEIDHNLRDHPSVRDAHCDVRNDDGTRRVVAYVIPEADGLEIGELREFLRGRLPSYMVPSRFVVLESFPLTTNGKIDNKSLPAPGLQDFGTARRCADATLVEQKVHDVWCRVLQRTAIALDDDFFGIGGDSLAALDVVSMLGIAGLGVKPQDLFDYPTISSLATVAVAVEPKKRTDIVLAPGEVVPLTPVQRWFFSLDLSDVHHFNRSAWLRTDEPIDADRLKEAISLLIERHDVLRYTYRRGAEGWQQSVALADQIDLDAVITIADPEADDEDLVRRVQTSFDLGAAPLIRVAVLPSGERTRLLVTAHHLIVDGVGINVLCDELDRAYRDGSTDLVAPASPFATWARECAEYANFGDPASEAEYWQAVMGAGSNAEPTRKPASSATALSVTRYESNGPVHEALTRCAAAQRVTVRDLLLAASISAVHEWNGASQVQVDIEGHGRHDLRGNLEVARTIGWFTVIYPIAVQTGRGNRLSVLRRTRRALDQVPRHGLGYGQLRYMHERGQGMTWRDADIAFNYLGRTADSGAVLIRDSSTNATHDRSECDRQPHNLAITPFLHGDSLVVDFTARASYANEGQLKRLTALFSDELAALLAEDNSQPQMPDALESFRSALR
ncbi:amino acid adenylation domain-containing protein [Rhodococcus maanshanensis]|uniref:amino acid adenylation domain-containing protein n=1 Tax=Rhodococcus maanshanensis TaxID=183556 RepID=UPI0022B4EE92|nr:amino acid adenylation domain-containing protein [Rhodococcus maanshanensis]MCZ4556598.1 amino acid adenylation domain-containing protein [Rhodococcus maanshanensis]